MTVAVLEIDDRFSLSRRLVAHSHSKLFLHPGRLSETSGSLIARGGVSLPARAL
jgi:hypothetical protein